MNMFMQIGGLLRLCELPRARVILLNRDNLRQTATEKLPDYNNKTLAIPLPP